MIAFDLQLFAEDSPTGQKTESATPFRREEARRRGQVAKSMDLTGVVVMVAGLLSLYAAAGFMMEELEGALRRMIGEAARGSIDVVRAMNLFFEVLHAWFLVSAPVLGGCFFAGLLANFAQVGFIFSFESMAFNPDRLNPIDGLKRLFTTQSINELAKSCLKIAAVAYLPWRYFAERIPEFAGLLHAPIGVALDAVARMTFDLSMQILLVLLILALIDYAYQYYEYEKSLMMSRYDVQQEMKQHDGDPHVKAAIRRRMAQMARRSLAKEVPKADVVVTNPTHYAVALRYRQDEGDVAPTCVAKGTNGVAEKIKEIARDNGIVIREDPPLARTLYAEVEVGETIPEQLFVAVAEVLAYVYKQKRGR